MYATPRGATHAVTRPNAVRSESVPQPPILYIVATPIGNRGDLSPRAIETLSSVARIFAEDTRHTRQLLSFARVDVPVSSYHDHSNASSRARVLAHLERGESVALVSDAGTPCIADPGYKLVSAARSAGFAVSPIPGPNAAVAFLSASGLPTDAFRFVGFAPRKSGDIQTAVDTWLASVETTVIYESPARLVRLLSVIARSDAGRSIAVGRELTKMHEEVVSGPAEEVHGIFAARERVRGECVVGIAGDARAGVADDAMLDAWVQALASTRIGTKEAATTLATMLGVHADVAYRALLERRAQSPD